MGEIILKALVLFGIVIFAYLLKQLPLFRGQENFEVVSRIVLYVTLPASIISNLNGTVFHPSLLLLCVFGFLCNWIYIAVSYIFGKDRDQQSFMMINMNGYNIGNFALPFITYFVQGTPILYVSMFDAGSALMVMSGNYLVARTVKDGKPQNLSGVNIIKRFFSSPAVVAYVVMVTLSLFSLSLPKVLGEFVGIIGGANTFLCMFMIGLALEMRIDREKLSAILKILSLRYGVALVLAVMVYFFLPGDLTMKKILIILLFAPVASAAPMFTNWLGGDLELSAQVNSLTIIISMVIISGLLTL